MFGLDLLFDYIECGNCQCLHLRNIPEDLSLFYPSNYYSFSDAVISRKLNNPLVKARNSYAVYGKPLAGKFLMHFFPKPELVWLTPIGLKKDTRVLDVGCGSGMLLRFLATMGMKNLTGIDPYLHENPDSSKQLELIKSDLFDITGEWDVIWFHHVFEHLKNPLDVLEKVASLLSPGGQCIIAIPTVSGEAWESYGTNWVQLDAPRHLFLHSVKSMQIMAEKSGFIISKILYNSTGFQFWASEQIKRGIPLVDKNSGSTTPREGLFTSSQLEAFERKAKQLNKRNSGDQAVFFMSKDPSS